MKNNSNVQGLKLQDKYLLTIKEAGAYFNNGTKKIRRMAESNEGMYALFMCNRYLIIRHKFEEYLDVLVQSRLDAGSLLLNGDNENFIQKQTQNFNFHACR